MHHSCVGSFDETFVDFGSVFVKTHVTYVIRSISFCFIAHGNHLTSLRIKFRMRRECARSQLSSKSIQPLHQVCQEGRST
jgi:hypothetical protein